MSDSRVVRFREAAEELRQGKFDVSIPVGEPDDLSELGETLQLLAAELKLRSQHNTMLARITERINEGLVLDEVLDHVYDNFASLIPFDRIGLALVEEDETLVRSRWVRSEASVVEIPVDYAAGLAGSSLEEILRTGRPRILNDLEVYLEKHPGSDSTRRIVAEGMRSSLTCPLVVRGRPVGFLFFSSMEKNTYAEIHQALFVKIAGQLAVILEKSMLYQELIDTIGLLREAKDALEHEATRDSLTGLWNRRSILELLKRDIARAQRDERPLAAVMIDIDHFKRINDRVGHLAGDQVLREVTRRITSTLRSADILGRIGGEEFLLVLYPADGNTAVEVMERARQSCAAGPIVIDAGAFDVTISLGAAVAEDLREVDPATVLKTADRALYRAKNGGRNRREVEEV